MAKFTGVSASAGIALILPATTGGHPTLWNPQGSGVNVHVRLLELSYVSGTNAPTAIEWAWVPNAGSNFGTGAPIATATVVAANPSVLGSGSDNIAKWVPTTNTFTAAPGFLRPAGIGLFTGAAATAVAPFVLRAAYEQYDFVIGPGTAICLCTQAASTTALFQVGLTWEEIAIA